LNSNDIAFGVIDFDESCVRDPSFGVLQFGNRPKSLGQSFRYQGDGFIGVAGQLSSFQIGLQVPLPTSNAYTQGDYIGLLLEYKFQRTHLEVTFCKNRQILQPSQWISRQVSDVRPVISLRGGVQVTINANMQATTLESIFTNKCGL